MGVAFFKALIPGALLTWIVSTVLGSQHVRGGMLAIEQSYVQGHALYWSWPLFFASTILAWAIFTMMD